MIAELLGATGEWNAYEFVLLRAPMALESALVVLAVGLGLFLTWRGLRREKRLRVRIALGALRLLTLFAVLVLWLEPAVQLQKRLDKKSQVALLVDRSRSMSLPGGLGAATRFDLARDFLTRENAAFKALATRYTLRSFAFDSGLIPLGLDALKDPKTRPEGEFSSLYGALKTVQESVPAGELAGVIVISDGVLNAAPGQDPKPQDVLEAYSRARVPVMAFGAGVKGGLKDLAIADVRADGFAFVRNKLTIEVTLKSSGYPPRSVPLTLFTDEGPLAVQNVSLPADGTAKTSFTFTPERVGRFLYGVSIPKDGDDAIPANNTRRFAIDVLRDKIRALLVSGHPDYDEQFLRRFLKNNPNVDLISFFILRTASDLSMVAENELSLIPFPTDELFDKQLRTFDLLIFQNFTYKGYQMEQYLANIERYVLQGGAFFMLGGDVSFGLGGYADTPIANILPVSLAANGPASDAAPFTPQAGEAALGHPILQLSGGGPEASAALLKNAPPFFGLNLGLTARPGAQVLLTHPTLKAPDASPAPVLAAWQAGAGRVLALAADSLWRWQFAADEPRGELYRRFLSNSIRWLMKDPELSHLTMKLDPETPSPGSTLQVELRKTDTGFVAKAGAGIRLKVIDTATNQAVFERDVTTDEAGAARIDVKLPATEGTLRVVAEPNDEAGGAPADNALEKQEALVAVSIGGREMAEIDVDFARLAELARATKGRFRSLPTTLGEGDLDFPQNQTPQIGKKRDVPLWDNAYTLAALVALLALEWQWRKRRRLP